jgi:hypothetical protein
VCGYVTANVCDVCIPAACPGQYECGVTTDGCGGTAPCGSCNGNDVCVNNLCCSPKTCNSPGVGCNTTSDGCGGPLDCDCVSPYVCDATGSCCNPIQCADVCMAGPYNGPDGCGNTIVCEDCGGPPT